MTILYFINYNWQIVYIDIEIFPAISGPNGLKPHIFRTEEEARKCVSENKPKVGDTVVFTPNGLYFRCENKKMEKWMQESGNYIKIIEPQIPLR
jgi:hypothetical protein